MEQILIKDAYENNLKHLNLQIPLNMFNCVTGCSGCGKSSLVYDTIFAECQREMFEGMGSMMMGQKLLSKPKVGQISNLRPAISISQQNYNVNPRSTISTVTDIADYLRSLFAFVNSDNGVVLTSNMFSSNVESSCCPNCSGLGTEKTVSERLLIPDRECSLLDGAILFFKGGPKTKEHAMLMALCNHYQIDPNKSISKLTPKELNALLYADDDIVEKISYKEGKRTKTHNIRVRGAIAAINHKLAEVNSLDGAGAYAKFIEDTTCHVCNGTKLRPEILDYKFLGLNYAQIEDIELSSLYSLLSNADLSDISIDKQTFVTEIIDKILVKVKSLLELNLGYLCLNRSIPSLSDGEKQRVRIASRFTCSLSGLIYILDEPCKGLHVRDVNIMIEATKKLINRNNTVIAIEHNPLYISSSDNIIELGPKGGPEGGYLIGESSSSAHKPPKLAFKEEQCFEHNFAIKNVNFRNIKNQTVTFPVGGITCVTGVSGSGKSTLVSVIEQCFSKNGAQYCESFSGDEYVKGVIKVNQSPIGKNPRSSIVSYLDIYEDIRNLFAQTAEAKKLKLTATSFSMNVKGERCECCQGTGIKKFELAYLPSSYSICPECNGKRFSNKLLSVKYKGISISDVLDMPINQVITYFEDSATIYNVLNCMITLGLGYLHLGQMSMNLSGGESQRIKLSKSLGALSKKRYLLILDEPTTGLNSSDIDKFIEVINQLKRKGETLLIIEHNVDFIAKTADYLIDFGVKGGLEGGIIAAQGYPHKVFNTKGSSFYDLNLS